MNFKSRDDPTRVRWSDLDDFVERQSIEDQNNPNIDYDIRISIQTNAEGKKVKQTDYIKIINTMVTVPRSVFERQQRLSKNKFGQTANNIGGNVTMLGGNVTMLGDEISIIPVSHNLETLDAQKQADKTGLNINETDKTNKQKQIDSKITCRNCGGPHWTRSCTSATRPRGTEQKDSNPSTNPGDQKPSTEGKYRPPGARSSNTDGSSSSSSRGTDEHEYKIRLNNLSDEVDEDSLYELLMSLDLGPISRINIIRDHKTQASRGFAFVIFYKKESAITAINKLDGYRFSHMVLQVEQAKMRSV